MSIEERLRNELAAASERARRAYATSRAAYEVVKGQLASGTHPSPETLKCYFGAMSELRRAMRDKGRIARVLSAAARRRARRARTKSSVSPPESQAHSSSLTEQHASIRILVVDDSVDGADCLALLLRNLGYESSAAYDGEAGIREALRLRPDVMLLDLAMPGLDGYGVLARLSQEKDLSRMRIVALTGYASDVTRLRTVEQGFFAYIVKPFELEQLQRVIESAIPGVSKNRRAECK
jgi:CheY-like chemotaxis protein